jgi:hypothetical protein
MFEMTEQAKRKLAEMLKVDQRVPKDGIAQLMLGRREEGEDPSLKFVIVPKSEVSDCDTAYTVDNRLVAVVSVFLAPLLEDKLLDLNEPDGDFVLKYQDGVESSEAQEDYQ